MRGGHEQVFGKAMPYDQTTLAACRGAAVGTAGDLVAGVAGTSGENVDKKLAEQKAQLEKQDG